MGLHAIELDDAYVMRTYARKPVTFVRGDGMRLYDDEGREYLDFVSGIGAISVGHANPAVAAALCEQAGRLLHVSNLYHVEHRGELARHISELLGGGFRVFFANSGAEANEGAIKLARRWGARHKSGAARVVSTLGSFHGRTLATLAATGQPEKQQAFAPVPEGFVHVPINDIVALEAAVDGSVAAVLLECIQGEGGVWPCDPAYLEAARRICDETGTLLMVDEVQTGCFRTGSAFAFQGYGIEVDVVTMAKGMGNGVPIGAFAARDDVASALGIGEHGTTFGGNPLVCAASRAAFAEMDRLDVGANACAVGEYLADRLGDLDQVVEVRGRGLMRGVTLSRPVAGAVVDAALAEGLVLNAIGTDILRFLPPLICTNREVDTLIDILSRLLETTE